MEGRRGRPRPRAHVAPPRDRRRTRGGAAVGTAGRHRRHRPRRRTDGRDGGVAQPVSARERRVGRHRRSRHRRRDPRVQLGHHGAAQGRAPHAPVDGPRHRRLVRRPRPRTRRPLPGGHSPLPHPRPAQPAGGGRGRRHRPPAPPLRPRRGAPPHRQRPHHARDGRRPHRPRAGEPPPTRGPRPLVAPLHHVGRHPGDRERGRHRHAAHRRPVAGGVRRQRAAGDRLQPRPRPVRLAARLRRPAAGRGRAARGRPRQRRGPRSRRHRGDPGPQPVGDGGLPARRGQLRGLRRRLVPHGGRGLARARRVGPSDRPLEGDDQGERLPGGAGRGRGGAARPSGRRRLRRVRRGRRAGRRGPRGGRAARPHPAAGRRRAGAARGRLAGDLQAPPARRRGRRHPPAPVGQGAAPHPARRVDPLVHSDSKDAEMEAEQIGRTPQPARGDAATATQRHSRPTRRHD